MRVPVMILACAMLGDIAHAGELIQCLAFTPDKVDATRQSWPVERIKRAPLLEMPPLSETGFANLNRAMLFKSPQAREWFELDAFQSPPTSTPTQADVTIPPFAAAGRLTFTDTAGHDGACTASFIDSSILITAAHCVADARGLFSDFFFSRAFGQFTAGEEFSITAVGVNDGWIQKGSDEFDYAFLRTKDPLISTSPLPLGSGSATGWIAFGYPNEISGLAAIDQPNGLNMLFASGLNVTPAGFNMIVMKGNPMGKGTSGGPWVPPTTPPFGGTVLTIGSAKNGFDTLYGPVLDDRALDVLKKVGAECGELSFFQP